MHELTHAKRIDVDVLAIARATRVHKLVPLLVMTLNAALMSQRVIDVVLLAQSVVFVLLSSTFGMQLNVLTDRELDRATKPELARQLDRNPQLLRSVLWAEALLCVPLLWAIATRAAAVAGALAAYGALFTCYSYNFFVPHRAAEYRLKAFWWGNASAVLGGYFALWITGMGAAHVDFAQQSYWLILAAAVSCLDYAMFLIEAAEDAGEERAHRLKTLPALLGRHGTVSVAAGLAAAGALGVISCAPLLPKAAAIGVASAATMELVAVAAAFARRHAAQRTRFGERLADIAFWAARAGTCSILLAARVLA